MAWRVPMDLVRDRRRSSSTRLPLWAVLAAGLAVPVPAQTVRLDRPDVRLDEEFTAIRGIRELPDGRVLVSDYRDQRVVVIDLARRTVTPRVTAGSGPREARLPTALIPIPGDSTLLVDLGNQRLLVLDPAGEPRRTIPADGSAIMGVRGVDRAGAFYYAIPGWMERGNELPDDSVRIVRRDPRTAAERTVAVIQGERIRSDIRRPALTPRIPIVGYASRDAWVVDDRGTIRIVRGGSYRVESRVEGAAPVVGPSHAYETAPVTAADRLAFVRRFNETSPTSGKGPNGGMGFSEALSAEEVARMAAGTQYAERHPMFSAGDVVAAPEGWLWVGLPARPGQATRYHVFDETGRRRGTVELGPARRVMAVTRSAVYVIAETDDGLQFLERYPAPRSDRFRAA